MTFPGAPDTPGTRTRGGTKRQPRGLRRTEQILAATEEVIAAVGVDAAGMNAIARQTGVSPGSLYQYFPSQYFPSKQAVVEALRRRMTGELHLRTRSPAPLPPGQRRPTPESAVDGLPHAAMALAQDRPVARTAARCRPARQGTEPVGELAARILGQGAVVAFGQHAPAVRTSVLVRTRQAILGCLQPS
ncbi:MULTISPECIES: TetR/AcrR family transcriptional regulator [unclassified Streptomyces]|uniref:TetR/AcrR family transcriptional regulator n=1 Tax=unclassified Streptomyces TaxID=2593676 RepID=UPI00225B84DD|nr:MULTISPECIES: TetR/AcrR family transcriptional regulator [unclassified Streptomyces]MCX4402657.1 TetR/AcrR family transcriptional regulator [Streptomyces sp. NBC_01764]MCX5182370.1 TetR/AcrR family transcriptional regulator [Streptomyces sp. NBC_00268]